MRRFRLNLADLRHRNEKILRKFFFDSSSLKQYFVTSGCRASLWASLEKFDFYAISTSSSYLGEAALKIWARLSLNVLMHVHGALATKIT